MDFSSACLRLDYTPIAIATQAIATYPVATHKTWSFICLIIALKITWGRGENISAIGHTQLQEFVNLYLQWHSWCMALLHSWDHLHMKRKS